MVSAVTPGDVAPPLSAPFGQGTTHGGPQVKDTLSRFLAGSQSGAANASGVPMPAPVGPAVAVPPVPVDVAPGAAVAPPAPVPTDDTPPAPGAPALDAAPGVDSPGDANAAEPPP